MATLFPAQTSALHAIGYARVAVERGVDQFPEGLTYAIDAKLGEIVPGDRVMVPLGRGNSLTPGYVIDVNTDTPLEADRIKFIKARDDSGARLAAPMLELARWISNYYCSPIGMTLATMLPAAVKKNTGAVRRTMVDLARAETELQGSKPSSKQRKVLETLGSLSSPQRPVEINQLAELCGLRTTGPIKKLIQSQALIASYRTTIEATWSEYASDSRAPERLTDEQQIAVNSIGSQLQHGFTTHLLFGVTGAGKTEVYIRLIECVVAQGKVALMLVPEISLTPQTAGRLIGRFPKQRVAILHSGLTAAQRHQQWALVEQGEAQIVLGARSAIFAPIAEGDLGLIIVDEEHDSSYKQDQVPRYHGRDVAIRRAQLAGCPIVLGSATPSLESWHNATVDADGSVHASTTAGSSAQNVSLAHKQKYELHRLRQRAPGLRLPKVHVVDFREQARQHKDRHVHLLGPMLEGAIARTLDSDGQVLILLNRRGYANYIACPRLQCGWIMMCDHCDVTMVYHLNRALPTNGYVRCHHCLSEQKLPALCPQCNSKISVFGLGTQRIEEELGRKFPQLVEGRTMRRIDSDTMHGSRDFHDALSRFGSGEIRLLVGTQMIAKGLDFPGVRLVGVINADTSINLPDFRASERTFQLVNQVAGRCGRGADPGVTIVQTFNPDSIAIRLAAAHDFEGFAELELAERQRSGLPPITRMCRIVLRDEDHVKCMTEARRVARELSGIISRMAEQRFRLRGPAPCPIARIADKHRQQVEIIAPTASLMQKLLAAARTAGLLKADAEMAIDVDPIALL